MSVLSEIVTRWHQAHPDFTRVPPVVLPWAAGRNWIATDAGRQQVEKSRVATSSKSRQSLEARMRRGAQQLGISLDEYRQHVTAGLKWCSGHQAWEPRQEFGRATYRPDGLATSCLAYGRAYANERHRLMGRGRKAS